MHRCLSMSSMFYGSMHMPIFWEELSMPTDRCSVNMPNIITNLSSGVLNKALSHI